MTDAYEKIKRDRKLLRLMLLNVFGVASIFLILAALCGIIAYFNREDAGYAAGILYVVIPGMSLGALISFLAFLRYFVLYRRLAAAKTADNREWTAKCSKVRFISFPGGRSFWHIYGVILSLDVNGRAEKYIYIFPAELFDSEQDKIKNILLNELHVKSYANTKVLYDIKEFVMIDKVLLEKRVK